MIRAPVPPRVPAVLSAALLTTTVVVTLTAQYPAGPFPTYRPPQITSPFLTAPEEPAEQTAAHELFQMRPEEPSVAAPHVVVYLDGWSWWNRLEVYPRRLSGGEVSVQGKVGDQPGSIPSGHHRLLVAIAPEWAWVPFFGAPGEEWQRFEVPITVAPGTEEPVQ